MVEQIVELLRKTQNTPEAPPTLALPQSPLVPTSGAVQVPSLATSHILESFADHLKSRYCSGMPGRTIQFPRPPTDLYFDLSLIEREPVEEKTMDHELASLAMKGRVKDMMEKRSKVELEDIFKLDKKKRKVILIEGPPGSGKTTLSWHICEKWESGAPFPEFRLVVYVQLRDPAIQAAQSIADLLPRSTQQMAQDVFAEMICSNGEGVLFILDGWDELPGRLQQDSPLRQLIEPSQGLSSPLQRSAVLVTSRPEASGELHDLASSRVQIIGFTPEKVEDYFTESLKGNSKTVDLLMEHIKENPAVEGICTLPLNAAIIVTLFLHMGHQLPSTLTGVFVALVLHCILRHCKARTDLSVRSLSSLDQLPAELQRSFDSLCELAFQGVLANKILFSENDVESLPEFATLSLLQVVESFVTVGSSRTYNFLHLSIQELLAAWHISRMPAIPQSEAVHGLLGHKRFRGVFRFYAGFTHFRAPWNKDLIRRMITVYENDENEKVSYS